MDYAYEVRENHKAMKLKSRGKVNGKLTTTSFNNDLVEMLDEIIAMLEAAGARRS